MSMFHGEELNELRSIAHVERPVVLFEGDMGFSNRRTDEVRWVAVLLPVYQHPHLHVQSMEYLNATRLHVWTGIEIGIGTHMYVHIHASMPTHLGLPLRGLGGMGFLYRTFLIDCTAGLLGASSSDARPRDGPGKVAQDCISRCVSKSVQIRVVTDRPRLPTDLRHFDELI